MEAVQMEELTSGASGRIIPVFRDIRRSVLSWRSLRRVFIFIQSFFLWFLLFLRRKRLSSTASPSKSSKRRSVWRRDEDDALGRRALAEGLEMVSGSEEGDVCRCSTYVFFGARRNSLFCRSWFPVSGDMKVKQVKVVLFSAILILQDRCCIHVEYFSFKCKGGIPDLPGKNRGIMIIIHGLNEHSGRYAHFARQLTACNYGVYAMDWIGHGGSDGLHGYVPSLDHVVADTGAFLEKVKLDNPGMPCFLFGHSTGGAVVLKAASYSHIEDMLEGIVLTSPALRVKPAHPIVGAVAPLFSLVVPKFQFKGANKRGIPVSRDPAALVAKYSDPLVYTGPIRVRTGHEILRICSYLVRNMKSVTVPFLVLHGTADKVTDPLASQDLYNEAASEFKDLKLYEGFLHDLLFEPEREEIAWDIINWMEKRLHAVSNLEKVNHW
ncbi:hypothetical protein HHK36_014190 [Tetracentron sinense]|uniref:Serine aminopeptidase S33 domain-containing protein n=1 Tax=Tetracentron sinense TaxID=13715 RepID=A0A834Z7J4_TETSI|nr:hypothetical protein HHK36_014190 [Tetracentron sinense]